VSIIRYSRRMLYGHVTSSGRSLELDEVLPRRDSRWFDPDRQCVAPLPTANSGVVVNSALCCTHSPLKCECNTRCQLERRARFVSRASHSLSFNFTAILARTVNTHLRVYKLYKHTRPSGTRTTMSICQEGRGRDGRQLLLICLKQLATWTRKTIPHVQRLRV
jgi:hypothetical protein